MGNFLGVLAVSLYVSIGLILEGRAWRHLRPEVRSGWRERLFGDGALYTERGQILRKVALWYWAIGGLMLLALLGTSEAPMYSGQARAPASPSQVPPNPRMQPTSARTQAPLGRCPPLAASGT